MKLCPVLFLLHSLFTKLFVSHRQCKNNQRANICYSFSYSVHQVHILTYKLESLKFSFIQQFSHSCPLSVSQTWVPIICHELICNVKCFIYQHSFQISFKSLGLCGTFYQIWQLIFCLVEPTWEGKRS